ncbi:hypothetical protein [Wolbachia endosymbiont (group A) of Epistrophe grossularia]|uniref:hypothetical protein n=1 Tax=Wolbachia endosymbiont (group A) of Epistrophe grossularia TaxID=2954008 RepID=UPI002230FD03|nr:hypothetical protein [Wolbachia endosymbiont (group A) of Epistrophe grossularia]
MVLYFIIREMMNKNNVPYYIAGTLATFTLLASGVFAAAPYIGFLAPIAALSVGLPFIIGYAVFSVVTIALSYKAISENKTNSELKNKMKAQEQTISGQKTQLAKKEAEVKAKEEENSKLKNKVEAQEEENSKLKDQVRTQKQKSSEQKTQLAEKNKKIEEDKLKVAIADGTVQLAKGTVNSAVWFAKEAVNGVLYSGKYAYDNYVPSTESTKGTLSGIGGGLKNTYDASIASVRGALNSVGSSLYSRIYGTKVSSLAEQFKRYAEDGSELSMRELTRLDYLDLAVSSSEQKQRANSLDYLNIDNVPKQPDHLNVDAAKSYLMSLSEDQDVFYDAESGDEKGTEISSPESQPTKEENGQGWFAWSLGKVKSAMTEVVVIDADVTKPYFAKVTKALAT